MPRRVLRDAVADRRFRRDGYVVVPFATSDMLAELREVYERLDAGIDSGYYASIYSADRSYKQEADREIRRIFWAGLDGLVIDHEPVVGAFMIKHPGEDSWVPPHQDWIVTDETAGGAINCWFPATAVDEAVGRMSVLPGSHRFLEGLRGSPAFPTQIGALSEAIAEELLEPVDVPLGHAIIYENRLLHGTPPNRSDHTRVVAYISAVPSGANRIHYHIDDEGTVRGHEVERDFFSTFRLGSRPEGPVFAELPNYQISPLTMAELRRRRDRANGWRRQLVR